MTLSAAELLDREFLEVRARLLETAAALDRIDRASNGPLADERLAQIREALVVLQAPVDNRAEQIQHVFSLEYDPHWKENLGLPR